MRKSSARTGSPPRSGAPAPAPAPDSPASANVPQSQRGWRHGVLMPSLASALLLWGSFAPLEASLLAWLAPLGWLWIVDRQAPVGRGGYVALWLSGLLFWLSILQGVRLAFWPLIFGWIAMSLYLAIYVPLFVVTARLLYHRWRLPLAVAAPLAWIGMEVIRGYLLTGYPGNSLAHTQIRNLWVIQLADQLGTAGIAWVMLAFCVGLLRGCQAAHARRLVPALPALLSATLLFCLLLGYGSWKLSEAEARFGEQEPVLRALLVQENTPTIFEYDPRRTAEAWTRYLNLTRVGVREHGPVDLVVWPESTFTANEPVVISRLTRGLPAELAKEAITIEEFEQYVDDYQAAFQFKVSNVLKAATGLGPLESFVANRQPPHLLVGCDYRVYSSEGVERYNAALYIAPDGRLVDQYSKMHLVMFGEYIPLGRGLKWLGDAFNFAPATPGQAIKSLPLKGVRLAPNICFESMIPHLISHQVRELAGRGESPDVLVNITNDSWFRGSSILDHHLASTILVAVENRRPTLVAANTGLSAYIDGSGRLQQLSQRLQPSALLAEVKLDGRVGLVQRYGYPLAWMCGLVSIMCWIVEGMRGAIKERYILLRRAG